MHQRLRYVSLFMVILTAFFTMTLSGCGGGGGASSDAAATDPTATTPTTASHITLGTDVPVTSKTIDSSGGKIDISGTSTGLDGVSISFAAGSLSASADVGVSYNTGSLTISRSKRNTARSSVTSSPILSMRINGGSADFDQPVTITIPYSDANDLPIPFYVDSEGMMTPVVVTSIDETNKTVSFITTHASTWTWIYGFTTDMGIYDSFFRARTDGFQIAANSSNDASSIGKDFGMTSFAEWYYSELSSAEGHLYNRFMNVIGQDAGGADITAQEIIATRALNTVIQSMSFLEFIAPNITYSDEYTYNEIVSTLALTNRPVSLLLDKVDDSGLITAKHYVLAYAVNTDTGAISIYDTDHPDTEQSITYDTSSKTFLPYGQYNKVFVNGIGTYSLGTAFRSIATDADHNFVSAGMPQITINSYASGASVTDRTVTLSGTVTGGSTQINKLKIYIGTVAYAADVAADGTFTANVSLEVGKNNIRFETYGDVDGQQTLISPNNIDSDPFILNLDVEASVMYVTMRWDTNDTDVDLYVIDPTGDYSSYYHKQTADGGVLDYDNTDGYGPEHWTLKTSDTVRWDTGSYFVRVHYYSDHANNIGTNYSLNVRLYEGTEYEVDYPQTGYLSTSNPSNDAPTGTGADWDNFSMPITLLSGNYSRNSVKKLRELPVIKAFIPDSATRRLLK